MKPPLILIPHHVRCGSYLTAKSAISDTNTAENSDLWVRPTENFYYDPDTQTADESFRYPKDEFPPTDNHTATCVRDVKTG